MFSAAELALFGHGHLGGVKVPETRVIEAVLYPLCQP
jgi:hypothetical protein